MAEGNIKVCGTREDSCFKEQTYLSEYLCPKLPLRLQNIFTYMEGHFLTIKIIDLLYIYKSKV